MTFRFARSRRSARKTPEFDFQKAVMQWLHVALQPPAFATAIDHAGKDRLTGALRKARGVMPGLADVWVFTNTGCRVLCLELKSKVGRATPEQLHMAAKLSQCGIQTWLCKSLEDVQNACDHNNVPLRQRLDPRSLSGARSVA